MARNKYPEQTVKLILDTAARLFLQQGYDGTSLQDIIDGTGLSKGAIYHHFTSKEDIFLRICDRIGEENAAPLREVRDSRGLTGLEKLRALFRLSLSASYQEQMLSMVPYLLDNPRFLSAVVRSIYEEVVPGFLCPILEEGVADGSIRTDHPKELAEALMTLCNVWLHPLLRPTAPEEIRARCAVYNQMTQAFGVDLLDEDLVEALVGYSQLLQPPASP